MTIRNRMAAPFAHLLGLAMAATGAEEDKDGKKGQRAEEDDEKKGRRAEEEDDDKDKKGKKAKGSEEDKDEKADDDDARRAEEDDDKDKEGKKAKRADDDDDDDDEMSGNSASAKARRRERSRCAAIFASAAAGVRPDVAAHVAFNTTMGRADAIAMLESVSAGHQPAARHGLGSRMAAAAVPHVGSGSGASGAPSNLSPVAKAIIAAGEKARP